jgi:hypothetical protein
VRRVRRGLPPRLPLPARALRDDALPQRRPRRVGRAPCLVELGDAALEAVLLRWRAGLAIPVAALAVWLGGADPVLATVAVGLLAVFALATEPPAEHG